MQLTKMEREVIEKIVELEMGIDNYNKINFDYITVTKREFTEIGQYVYLANRFPLFDNDIIFPSVLGETVGINLNDLGYGIDFLLYTCSEGFDLLECHTYGETWPYEINDYALVTHKPTLRDSE